MKYWFSYLIPQKVAEYRSPFNRYIRINVESGKMKLLVNGSPQSGPYIDILWDAALGAFDIVRRSRVQKILVLGIAGGTVIQKMHQLFPAALITGVEIDPVMIEIGKKYFALGTIQNFTAVCADAKKFVKTAVQKKNTYDLVIVDMSFGRVIPPFVSELTFIGDIKSILSKNGCVVINYLRELEYQKLSNTFMKRLQNNFFGVRDHLIYRNRFFFGSIV